MLSTGGVRIHVCFTFWFGRYEDRQVAWKIPIDITLLPQLNPYFDCPSRLRMIDIVSYRRHLVHVPFSVAVLDSFKAYTLDV